MCFYFVSIFSRYFTILSALEGHSQLLKCVQFFHFWTSMSMSLLNKNLVYCPFYVSFASASNNVFISRAVCYFFSHLEKFRHVT